MSTFFVKYPQGGVPVFPTFANFPVSASSGSLAVANDTGDLYVFHSGTWDLLSSPGGGGITQLTGDVSASGSGSVAATVNAVGGSTAASVHTAQLNVAAGPSQQLYVDASHPGTYTADGSILRPFKTIAAAVAQVISNGNNSTVQYTINIVPASYNETISLNSSSLYNLVFTASSGSSQSSQNVLVGTAGAALSSTSNNTQLASLVFSNITFEGSVNLTGDVNGTNFASSEALFTSCQFNDTSSTITLNNVNNVNLYDCTVQDGSHTFTNVAFAYIQGVEGIQSGSNLTLVNNNSGNQPSQFAGNYLLMSMTKLYATTSIDAGSELDMIHCYVGSTAAVTCNGTMALFGNTWKGTLTANSGSNITIQADNFLTAPTINSGATVTNTSVMEFAGWNINNNVDNFYASETNSSTFWGGNIPGVFVNNAVNAAFGMYFGSPDTSNPSSFTMSPVIASGDSNAANATMGPLDVWIQGGNVNGAGSTWSGANVNIAGGNTAGASGNGGGIFLAAGNGNAGNTNGGVIQLAAGNGHGAGTNGKIELVGQWQLGVSSAIAGNDTTVTALGPIAADITFDTNATRSIGSSGVIGNTIWMQNYRLTSGAFQSTLGTMLLLATANNPSGTSDNIEFSTGSASGAGNHSGNIPLVVGSASGGATQGEIQLNSPLTRIYGHIKSYAGIGAPSPTVTANAGTGASTSVSSPTDTAGFLSFTTGTLGWAAGAQVSVSFNVAYNTAPVVILYPTNSAAAQAKAIQQDYVTSSTSGFVLNYVNAATGQVTTTWSYLIIEPTS